jgi:hypothetical protein
MLDGGSGLLVKAVGTSRAASARGHHSKRLPPAAQARIRNVIAITSDAEWDQLRSLNVVVDPTIYRTAEVFFQGERAARDKAEVWKAISANVGSLATFVDAIILNDKLPIFDYLSTFPDRREQERADDARLVDLCNRNGEVLVPVTVDYAAYWTVKEAAVAELGTPADLPREAASGILQELSAFDWAWAPKLHGWEEADPEDRVLGAFLYGGLLFGGYAKRIGGQHLIQPKRARLYAAAALREAVEGDEVLFSRLERLPGEAPDDVESADVFPPLPSFLPYLLLADPGSPDELLQRALGLRNSPAVGEYRDWRNKLVESLALGRRAREKQAEVAQIWSDVERELQPRGDALKFKWSVEALFLGIPVPRLTVEGEADAGRLYAWTLRKLPGHRYQKLMMRMKAAHGEYVRVNAHLRQLWQAPRR